MILFEEVPKMLDNEIRSKGGSFRLDDERCAALAVSCRGIDMFAMENGAEKSVSADISVDSSVLIRIPANSFIMDRGREDPLYMSMFAADDLVFRYVDEDTLILELRFDDVLVRTE